MFYTKFLGVSACDSRVERTKVIGQWQPCFGLWPVGVKVEFVVTRGGGDNVLVLSCAVVVTSDE